MTSKSEIKCSTPSIDQSTVNGIAIAVWPMRSLYLARNHRALWHGTPCRYSMHSNLQHLQSACLNAAAVEVQHHRCGRMRSELHDRASVSVVTARCSNKPARAALFFLALNVCESISRFLIYRSSADHQVRRFVYSYS